MPAAPARDQRLVRALAAWFESARRDLPWRAAPGAPRDPYHVLVSEVMLQQTQVSRVAARYPSFIQAFPTIAHLAAAPEDAVLALWSGLGYYRRARLLHAAARAVVAQHRGVMPTTLPDLLALPGVGRYTAGAVASLAYGSAAPIVDGNVARVLIRIEGQDLSSGADGLAWSWPRAEQLVNAATASGTSPAILNEALMELGATICTPATPRCPHCPLRRDCAATTLGLEDSLPRPKPRAARKRVRLDALLLQRPDGQVLMEKQPEGALWSGLWQPPTAATAGRTLAPRLRRLLAAMKAGRPSRAGTLDRTLTHRDVTFTLWTASPQASSSEALPSDSLRWLDPASLAGVGVSSACVALLSLAGAHPRTQVRSAP